MIINTKVANIYNKPNINYKRKTTIDFNFVG